MNFLLDLCLAMGKGTIAECIEYVGGMAGLALWRAKYRVDPWGQQRADLRHARFMAAYHAAHGVKDAKTKDFFLYPMGD